jgi:hypothetical protein
MHKGDRNRSFADCRRHALPPRNVADGVQHNHCAFGESGSSVAVACNSGPGYVPCRRLSGNRILPAARDRVGRVFFPSPAKHRGNEACRRMESANVCSPAARGDLALAGRRELQQRHRSRSSPYSHRLDDHRPAPLHEQASRRVSTRQARVPAPRSRSNEFSNGSGCSMLETASIIRHRTPAGRCRGCLNCGDSRN